MKKKLIPWVKQEDFVFVEGELLLAIDTKLCLPLIVRVLNNGKVENCLGKYRVYEASYFDYYATITYPK